jgi:hypothetical protein
VTNWTNAFVDFNPTTFALQNKRSPRSNAGSSRPEEQAALPQRQNLFYRFAQTECGVENGEWRQGELNLKVAKEKG